MKTKFFLLTSILFFAFAPLFAGNDDIKTANSINETTQSFCGVTAQQICEYMASFGYTVTSITSITGSCDVYVKTTIGKTFIVHISNGIITGYDDTQQ